MESAPVEFDPFLSGEIARTAPSTEPQREIITSTWMGEEANTAFNEAVSLRVSGNISPKAIGDALSVIVDRHDALRMTFTSLGDEACVTARNAFSLEEVDLTGLDEAAQKARIQSLWSELVGKPMDLYQGPLFRAIWVQLGENLGELVLLAHHVVCDGWSFHVILEELSSLCSGTPPGELEDPVSFADFAERQSARAASNADVDYWNKRFESKPPILDLPTDRARPALRSFAAARIDHAFDADLAKSIALAAGKLKASVVNVALAGTAALIHRLTGATDMAIGLPVARQGIEDLPGLVGHGVQLLPIRLQVEQGDSFQDLVGRAKTATLDAREHFDFTFGALIRDLGLSGDRSRVPLVPVIFNIDQPFGELKLGPASATLRTVPRTAENFEIFLNVLPTQKELVVEATFNTDLFSAETIRSWLVALENLLADGTANPSKSISALSLGGASPEIYRKLNDTARSHPSGTWLDRLASMAAREPDAIAAVDGKGVLSYAELMRRAGDLARVLAQRGATRGSLVGIYMNRSCELLIAVAAVHQAGAAYLPLDPSFPESRLAFMLGDSGSRLVLTDIEPPAWLAEMKVDTLRLPLAAASGSSGMPTPEIGAGDLAYIIYTSGSTGKPKGVEVTHGGVVNFLDSMGTRPGFTGSDTLLAVTTLSFDISVLELLLPLTRGGRVVVATRDEAVDARRLAELMARHGVTVMQATPATWRLLLNDGWSGRKTLTALCGGESLPVELAAALLGKVKSLWNLYGPTETTIWSSCEQIMPETDRITIGSPIDNTVFYVMDTLGQPLPAAIPGELWIGGAGVARGYHGRPDLTAERFVDHPRLGRLYRTGDRGRVLGRGVVEHLGRLDFQVKVRGFRIELGEIEAGLAAHPEVVQAVVIAREDEPGDVRLVAYLVARSGIVPAEDALRAHLRNLLPEYMVPQHFVILPALPVLPNGKLDRKSLPAPDTRIAASSTRVAPQSDLEKAVASEMESVLSVSGIGVHDDFFTLGGHSLLAAQLASRLNESFNTGFSMKTLFEAPSVARLAAAIEAQRLQAPTASSEGIKRLASQSRVPASLMQERMWLLETMKPGRVVYHAPSAHRLRGLMNESAFERAFQEIIRRQSSLRTSFERDGGTVMQRVHDHVSLSLFPAEDLSHLAPGEREATLHRRLEELTAETFDLTKVPVFKARMFRLAEKEHVLFFMPHHIIWDGWSFDLFYSEISALYEAYSAGRPSPLTDLPISYGDFSVWHRKWVTGPEFGAQLAFWRERLTRIGKPMDLPTDRPRGAGMSGAGGTEWIAIDKSRADALHELSARSGVTLFMTMLAAFCVLLYGYGRQNNLVIGTPVRGRNSPELEAIMGYFNNLLPLQLEIDPQQAFTELVGRVKTAVMEIFAHPDVPLEQLSQELSAARAGSGSMLYQALFSFQDGRQRITRWDELAHEMIPLFQQGATEDIGMWFVESTSGLQGGLTYNTDILAASTAQGLRDQYLRIMDAIIALPEAQVTTLAGAGKGVAAGVPEERDSASGDGIVSSRSGAAYVAPGNDLEISLARVWEKVLGVPRVGVTDNFFELGGNSLTAINLVLEMEQATGIEMDLGEVFRAPTIAQLVSSFDPQAKREAAVVVPLQREGRGLPVFCLCGINIYKEFADSLGKEQPVFGVYVAEEQAIANQVIKGGRMDISIERLVEAYDKAITRFRPNGPYRLAGVSFGGILAMELASQMRRRGVEVEAVILLDTFLPDAYRRNWIKWVRQKAAAIVQGHPGQMLRQLLGRVRDRLARRWRQARDQGRLGRVDRAFSVRQSIAFEEAARNWQPRDSVSDLRVILFRASDHTDWGSLEFDEDYGWRRYVGARLRTVDVPGNHLGILDRPNVDELGRKAQEFLSSRT